ncbi:MAG: hypothetical protein IKM59_05685 [Oscillospiraceae bacterium]|nr:hypothetical protein [Oscillospiraceae bacterium]
MNVEMISVCGADGKLTPIRFRMEGEDQELQVVPILQVMYCNPIQHAGIDALQYLCKGKLHEQIRLFELRYTLKTHCWSIYRVVS